MVDYYFESEEIQVKLLLILKSWLDTPFRHKCGVKGLGCDCVHFTIGVLDELKIINKTKLKIPDYPRDWHEHNTRELLKEAILKYLNVEEFTMSEKPSNGDIILSHYGKASSHVGVFYDGYVYQAINKIGVKKINFKDRQYRPKMKYIFRILK